MGNNTRVKMTNNHYQALSMAIEQNAILVFQNAEHFNLDFSEVPAGKTSLTEMALEYKRFNILGFLIEHGAPPTVEEITRHISDLVELGIVEGKFERAGFDEASNPAAIDFTNDKGNNLYHYAAQERNMELLRALYEIEFLSVIYSLDGFNANDMTPLSLYIKSLENNGKTMEVPGPGIIDLSDPEKPRFTKWEMKDTGQFLEEIRRRIEVERTAFDDINYFVENGAALLTPHQIAKNAGLDDIAKMIEDNFGSLEKYLQAKLISIDKKNVYPPSNEPPVYELKVKATENPYAIQPPGYEAQKLKVLLEDRFENAPQPQMSESTINLDGSLTIDAAGYELRHFLDDVLNAKMIEVKQDRGMRR